MSSVIEKMSLTPNDLEFTQSMGITNQIMQLQSDLYDIEHVVDVEFDFGCYVDCSRSIAIVVTHDLLDTREAMMQYDRLHKKLIRDIAEAVLKKNEMIDSGDAIEGYGENWIYFVVHAPKSWSK